MNLYDIIFLAIALSIDAGVVSFSQGLIICKNKRKNSFLLALFTGFFQFLMPILGFVFASVIYEYVKTFASVIASAIFFVLGIKFIYDAIKKDVDTKSDICCLSLKCLLMIALATSIDALAAGVNFRFLDAPLFLASAIIGIITFVVSLLGFFSGYLFKKFPSKYLEIFSGIILIILALKIYV